jgi:DNA-binding MarR family transcriptional regulator
MSDFSIDAFDLLNVLVSITEKFILIEKTPFSCGGDVKVYPSQIRAIVMIGHHPGTNLTGLAQGLEVTKASASELVAKLVENGLVVKSRDPGNDKEVRLHISPECQTILKYIDHRHEQIYQEIKAILGEMPETNYELVIRLLKRVDYYLDQFAREA